MNPDARLRSAWKLAETSKPDGLAVGLAVQLRTLGVGQVLAMFAEKTEDKVGLALRELLNAQSEITKLDVIDPGKAVLQWRSQIDFAAVRAAESAAIAWAVDLRLCATLLYAERLAPPSAPAPFAARDAWALAVANRIYDANSEQSERALSVVAGLPHRLLVDGLLRSLGTLCRDGHTDLAFALIDRLHAHPSLGVPAEPIKLGAWLTDPQNADAALAAEAEALQFADRLKLLLRATFAGAQPASTP